jgi:hypothetical protein
MSSALPDARPLYQRILGESWPLLAPEIRELHAVTATSLFTGRCSVHRGQNLFARLLARVIGFPRAGADQPISVTLSVEKDGERWVRCTGDRSFCSVQYSGRGRSEGLVRERFGPVAVDMSLVVNGATLHYFIRRWSFCGIPLPLYFGPRTIAVECVTDGRFSFDVEISHPLTGLIVRYRGTLSAAAT